MLILARWSVGRILLHLMAMSRNGAIRFHTCGILRECQMIVAPVLVRGR